MDISFPGGFSNEFYFCLLFVLNGLPKCLPSSKIPNEESKEESPNLKLDSKLVTRQEAIVATSNIPHIPIPSPPYSFLSS